MPREHSGADEVSAFTDVGDDEIAVYRPRSRHGFDPDELSPELARDRRLDPRPHGRAPAAPRRSSSSADGTEVELRLERRS